MTNIPHHISNNIFSQQLTADETVRAQKQYVFVASGEKEAHKSKNLRKVSLFLQENLHSSEFFADRSLQEMCIFKNNITFLNTKIARYNRRMRVICPLQLFIRIFFGKVKTITFPTTLDEHIATLSSLINKVYSLDPSQEIVRLRMRSLADLTQLLADITQKSPPSPYTPETTPSQSEISRDEKSEQNDIQVIEESKPASPLIEPHLKQPKIERKRQAPLRPITLLDIAPHPAHSTSRQTTSTNLLNVNKTTSQWATDHAAGLTPLHGIDLPTIVPRKQFKHETHTTSSFSCTAPQTISEKPILKRQTEAAAAIQRIARSYITQRKRKRAAQKIQSAYRHYRSKVATITQQEKSALLKIYESIGGKSQKKCELQLYIENDGETSYLAVRELKGKKKSDRARDSKATAQRLVTLICDSDIKSPSFIQMIALARHDNTLRDLVLSGIGCTVGKKIKPLWNSKSFSLVHRELSRLQVIMAQSGLPFEPSEKKTLVESMRTACCLTVDDIICNKDFISHIIHRATIEATKELKIPAGSIPIHKISNDLIQYRPLERQLETLTDEVRQYDIGTEERKEKEDRFKSLKRKHTATLERRAPLITAAKPAEEWIENYRSNIKKIKTLIDKALTPSHEEISHLPLMEGMLTHLSDNEREGVALYINHMKELYDVSAQLLPARAALSKNFSPAECLLFFQSPAFLTYMARLSHCSFMYDRSILSLRPQDGISQSAQEFLKLDEAMSIPFQWGMREVILLEALQTNLTNYAVKISAADPMYSFDLLPFLRAWQKIVNKLSALRKDCQ